MFCLSMQDCTNYVKNNFRSLNTLSLKTHVDSNVCSMDAEHPYTCTDLQTKYDEYMKV